MNAQPSGLIAEKAKGRKCQLAWTKAFPYNNPNQLLRLNSLALYNITNVHYY